MLKILWVAFLGDITEKYYLLYSSCISRVIFFVA